MTALLMTRRTMTGAAPEGGADMRVFSARQKCAELPNPEGLLGVSLPDLCAVERRSKPSLRHHSANISETHDLIFIDNFQL